MRRSAGPARCAPPTLAQALVDGTVLGVDRHQFRSRRLARPLDDGPAGDQGLLVGQGQAPARLQSGQGHGEAGEAHYPVDHYVGVLGDGGQRALTS